MLSASDTLVKLKGEIFSASDTLVKLKEIVKKNKYVRYAVYTFSSLMILATFQNIYIKVYRKYYRLPNGPIGYPLIGIFPQYAFHLKDLLKTIIKYGPISHYQILGGNMCIINDYKLARLILSDERLLTRTNLQDSYTEMLPMTTTSNGKEWAEGRRILFSSLTKLTNKSFVEKAIKRTLEEHTFIALNKKINNNELWFPGDDCRHVAFNTIYSGITGELMSINDDRFEIINLYLSKWLQSLPISFTLPSFRSIVTSTTIAYQNKLVDLFSPIIVKSIENYNENNLVTWLDYTLYEMSAINNAKNQTNKNNNKLNITEKDIALIKGDIITLLSAGVDTTSYALEYAILTLAKYPKYQELIYNELIEKFENKQSFNLSKLNECPLFRAFISEVLRYGIPSAPGGVRHAYLDYPIEITKDNVTEEYASYIGKKYVKKKYSSIIFNYYHMVKSEVEDFDINNWLKYDEINDTYKYESNHPNVFPFSLGKRSCPGEVVALNELHACIGYLILMYKIKSTVQEDKMEIKTITQLSQFVEPKIPVIAEKRY